MHRCVGGILEGLSYEAEVLYLRQLRLVVHKLRQELQGFLAIEGTIAPLLPIVVAVDGEDFWAEFLCLA